MVRIKFVRREPKVPIPPTEAPQTPILRPVTGGLVAGTTTLPPPSQATVVPPVRQEAPVDVTPEQRALQELISAWEQEYGGLLGGLFERYGDERTALQATALISVWAELRVLNQTIGEEKDGRS